MLFRSRPGACRTADPGRRGSRADGAKIEVGLPVTKKGIRHARHVDDVDRHARGGRVRGVTATMPKAYRYVIGFTVLSVLAALLLPALAITGMKLDESV